MTTPPDGIGAAADRLLKSLEALGDALDGTDIEWPDAPDRMHRPRPRPSRLADVLELPHAEDVIAAEFAGPHVGRFPTPWAALAAAFAAGWLTARALRRP
jgi:hypothetical protein